MSTSDWRQLGFLNPDALECQQDVWALQALLRRAQADVLAGLASRTAEPTWSATLEEGAGKARETAETMRAEAGEPARERVADDDLVRAFEASLDEVLASEHVPALVTTGYAVLGELGALPVQLLEEVAGPYSRPLCGRLLAEDDHRVLGRLFPITQPSARDKESLRRMLRHLNQGLFAVYQGWRQTFHALGVDGEHLAEAAVTTVREALVTLEMPSTNADVRFLRA